MININDFVLQVIGLQVLTVNPPPQIKTLQPFQINCKDFLGFLAVNFSAGFKGDQHAQQED